MNMLGPLNGAEHLDGKDCWCQPNLYYVTTDGSPIWHHRDDPKDKRRLPGLAMVDVIAELAWQDCDKRATK